VVASAIEAGGEGGAGWWGRGRTAMEAAAAAAGRGRLRLAAPADSGERMGRRTSDGGKRERVGRASEVVTWRWPSPE